MLRIGGASKRHQRAKRAIESEAIHLQLKLDSHSQSLPKASQVQILFFANICTNNYICVHNMIFRLPVLICQTILSHNYINKTESVVPVLHTYGK